MNDDELIIPPDPEITGLALQKWSANRIELASERISGAGKLLFTASIGSAGVLVTLMRFSSIPEEYRICVWWSLVFFLFSGALSLGMVTILYFKIGSTSDLKADFLSQQNRYHFILGLWFLIWSAGVYFASKAFIQI